MIATLDDRFPVLKVLHHRPFFLLWSGQCVSTMGDGVFRVALAWSVLRLSGSALAMGAVYFATLVPTILLTLFGGVAADRLPRKMILLFSDGGRGIIVGLIAVLAWWHLLQLWHLFVLSLLFGVADAFFTPAYHSFVPQLFGESELLQPANSLIQSSAELSRILGPVVGAALVVGSAGGYWAFAADALTFFFSAACLMTLRLPKKASISQEEQEGSAPEATGVFAGIGEGFRYVATQPWLYITILLAAVSNVSYSAPLAAVLPKLVSNVYRAGPGLFGLLVSTDAAGFLAASLLLAFVHFRRRGLVAYSAVGVSCLGLMVLGFPLPHVSEPFIATIACFCAGCGIGTFSVIEISLMQEKVPGNMIGRVSSIDMFGSFLLLPVGLFMVGGLADHFGSAPIFLIGGVLSLLFALAGLCVKSIRDLA